MTRKVDVAVFDNDLRIELKKYELNKSGTKISIIDSGEGYFMPEIGTNTFLEFPSWKKYLLFGPRTWKRVYFVKRQAKKCVNFSTSEVYSPDPEQLKQAIGSTLLGKLGKEDPPFPTWMIYLILLCVVGIALKVFGVIV